jgi:peptide/nickel transport system substrate-binding protein
VFGEKGESLFTGNLHSRDPAKGLGTLNFHGYSNPKVDQLIEETFSTMDVERQKATRQEAMRLIIEDGILLPLWHTVNATAVRAGLDFTPRPDFMIYPTSVRPKP